MPPPATPRITVGPSQLRHTTPSGRDVRRFTHNGAADLVPDKEQRYLEIGPTRTRLADLRPKVAALREELGEIPGVGRVNIMQRYLTIESSIGVSWDMISAAVAAVLKQHLGWTTDPIIKMTKNLSEAH